MRNYEIYLIRDGNINAPYPNVGKVYVSPLISCAESAKVMYPEQTLHTAATLLERDTGKNAESDEDFALRCVAGLNQIFTDMTRNGVGKAALITYDEAIVTLMAGCGLPKSNPTEFILEPGEGWLIRMTAYLWQKGYAFEIIGKLAL